MIALLSCVLAVAAVMFAARAARRARALGEEVERLSGRVRELSRALEDARARGAADREPAKPPPGEEPEPGRPRSLH